VTGGGWQCPEECDKGGSALGTVTRGVAVPREGGHASDGGARGGSAQGTVGWQHPWDSGGVAMSWGQ